MRSANLPVFRTIPQLTLLQLDFFNEVQNGGIEMSDLVRVRGRISEINYFKVINGSNLISYQRVSRANTLPAPVKLTLAEIAADGEQYESCLVTVVDMTVASDGNLFYREDKSYQMTDVTNLINNVVIRIGSSPTHIWTVCLSFRAG